MSSEERTDYLHIANPEFVKGLDHEGLSLLCQDIRRDIIRACSQRGGHLSSNLGDVELVVALHRCFDFSKDKLIFDVGHQCYAHKILTGRSLETLNAKGGLAGFQKMHESPYDPWEAGHSSTSLSAAQAYAIARDARGEKFDVVAFIGDSSVVNGLAFEALNDIGSGPNKVIVVLNDNDMSISQPTGGLGKFFRRISTGAVYNKTKSGYTRLLHRTRFGRWLFRHTSRLKNWIKSHLVSINMFDNMGFAYVGPINGHDIKAIERAIKRAKNVDRSVILHVRTIKGKGYAYAENDKTGYWHGVTPFDIDTGAPKSLHEGYVSWSHFFADLTAEFMGMKKEAYLVVPATRKGSGLEKAFSLYPERCHDVGIAEEHAATLCGGLYVNGFHPILSIYSTFLQRAYDEISHDVARLGGNMTLLIDRAGFAGKNGDTHQGIYDVAYLKSIPGTVVAMPSTKSITRALYGQSFDGHGVFAIRYPRELVVDAEDSFSAELPFLRFRHDHRASSKKLAIVAVGPKEKELLKAVESRYLDVEIVDPVYLHPIQKDNVYPLLRFDHVLIYDAYGVEKGFAESLCATLAECGYRGKIVIRAIPNDFIPFDSYQDQLKEHGLLPEQIVELAKKIIGIS